MSRRATRLRDRGAGVRVAAAGDAHIGQAELPLESRQPGEGYRADDVDDRQLPGGPPR